MEMVDNEEVISQIKLIQSNLNRINVSSKILRKLAKRKYGLVKDEYRAQIWPLLCNIFESSTNVVLTKPTPIYSIKGKSNLSVLKSVDDVICKDAKRSYLNVNKYSKLTEDELIAKQEELEVLMKEFYMRNTCLSYIQGVNDVFAMFVRVLGQELGYACSEVTIKTHMREISQKEFNVSKYVEIVYRIIESYDIELAKRIEGYEKITFTIKWIIPWFAHTQKNDTLSARIYDLLLASNPLKQFYISAAIITLHKTDIANSENLFELFQNFDFNSEEDIEIMQNEIRLIKNKVSVSSLRKFCSSVFDKSSFMLMAPSHWYYKNYKII